MSLSEPPPRSSVPYARVVSRPARRRSAFLSSYLFLLLCACVVSLVMFISRGISLFGDIPDLSLCGSVQSGLTFAFLLAVWQWRRWGLYGVVGITLIGTVLSLAYGKSIPESLLPLFFAVALPLLAEQSWDEIGNLEWRWEPETPVAGPSQAPESNPLEAGPSQAPEPKPLEAGLSQATEPDPMRPSLSQVPVGLREEDFDPSRPEGRPRTMKDEMSLSEPPPRPPVPYFDPPAPPIRRRGGVLTFLLLFMITANVISGVMFLSRKISLIGDIPGLPVWGGIQVSLSLVFLIAIWQWRRWGFYGLVATTFIGFLLSLGFRQPLLETLGPLVCVVALGLLVTPRWTEMSDSANLWEPPLMGQGLDRPLAARALPPESMSISPVPRADPPPRIRSRTGCFTAYLLFMILGGIFGFFLYIFFGDSILRTIPSLPGWVIPLGIIESAFCAIFALAVWNWRRLGVYGLLFLFVLNLFARIFANLGNALASLAGILLFVLLLIPHWKQMED